MANIKAVLERPHDVLCTECGHRAVEHTGLRACFKTTGQVISEARHIALACALKHIEALERPRAEVRTFALLMEAELAKHEDRAERKDAYVWWLLRRLREETNELEYALRGNYPVSDIGEEAADIANFATMIADVAGALRKAEEKKRAHICGDPSEACDMDCMERARDAALREADSE